MQCRHRQDWYSGSCILHGRVIVSHVLIDCLARTDSPLRSRPVLRIDKLREEVWSDFDNPEKTRSDSDPQLDSFEHLRDRPPHQRAAVADGA